MAPNVCGVLSNAVLGMGVLTPPPGAPGQRRGWLATETIQLALLTNSHALSKLPAELEPPVV